MPRRHTHTEMIIYRGVTEVMRFEPSSFSDRHRRRPDQVPNDLRHLDSLTPGSRAAPASVHTPILLRTAAATT